MLPEPERFHALLGTGDVDAKSRFKDVSAALPVVLVTGKKFAANFAALMATGPLGEGIAATETGAALYETAVATNTAPGGVHWKSTQAWLGAASVQCDKGLFHLYCLEV